MNEFIITATRTMKSYAAKVAGYLAKFSSFAPFAGTINGIDLLSTDLFADGEKEVVIDSSIRGKDVFIFASCARNEAGLGVDEAKIELYHAVDALKRAQAERIVVFEPFMSCSRSDRTARRSSVGLWVHLKTLSSLGARHFVSYQLHSDKSKSMIDPARCVIDDIPALTLLKRRLCDVYIRDIGTLHKEVRPNWAFCSVDAGGEKLARRFSNSFGVSLVIAHKQRDYTRKNTVECVNILSAEPVEGKVLWIVDDMIDTGASIETLVRALWPFKPAEINLMAVHPVFSNPAPERLQRLYDQGYIKHVIVTDTICCSEIPHTFALEIVPSAELSARAIHTIAVNGSMAKLLREFNAETYLTSPSLLNQPGREPPGLSSV
ncbi:MAG: ribose-phosphate diphosphokinase [Spirochaetaceae bacterium]|jgi:ribose-phosphate pyrophosphokinase|nr:ribose-phosphate diphosphokinase [Spirochaetaceae bacterium]